jgi:hypothetical protein
MFLASLVKLVSFELQIRIQLEIIRDQGAAECPQLAYVTKW